MTQLVAIVLMTIMGLAAAGTIGWVLGRCRRASEDRAECEAVRAALEPVFFDGLGAVWGATTEEVVACVRGLARLMPSRFMPSDAPGNAKEREIASLKEENEHLRKLIGRGHDDVVDDIS